MDLLSSVLAQMKLQGTLYFRTAFSPPWGVRVPAFENVARFHYVHRGRCWLEIAGVETPLLLEQGDLVLVTRGAEHVLADSRSASVKTVDEVVAESGFTGEGALVYGTQGQGHDTQLVCGHFAFDRDASHPLIEALPPYLHVRNTGDVSHLWLDSTLKLIGSETGDTQLGGDLITLKLSEIIFTQAIRAHLALDGRRQRVFSGLADPGISRALRSIHREPSKTWTLDALARDAGLSRTVFADRFRDLMGMTVMQYLTGWRMQAGRRLLIDSDKPIIEVAERSGYRSEAAFGRVFKKHFSMGPAAYRRLRRERLVSAAS